MYKYAFNIFITSHNSAQGIKTIKWKHLIRLITSLLMTRKSLTAVFYTDISRNPKWNTNRIWYYYWKWNYDNLSIIPINYYEMNLWNLI